MKDQYNLDDSDELIRLRDSWELVLLRLKDEVPSAWFERFIRPIRPIALLDNTASLAAPGKFVADWVRGRYQTTFAKYLADELGFNVDVDLLIEPQSKDEVVAATSRVTAAAAPQPVTEDTRFKPIERYSFDSFVVGQSNRMAFAGAKAVASEPGTRFNPLFIYGQSGLGKTHLLHSIAREVLAVNPDFSLVYVTAQQFAESFVNALQTGKTDAFRRSQRNVGMWLVDDIQFIAGKDKTSEEIFHTFNHLHSLGKQIVLCSDRPPRDLYLMDERLRSRFEAGLVADIQMPDTETRTAILLSKAAQDRVQIDHNLAQFLAENVPGNIRTLEGALTKLIVQASVRDEPVSMELAAQMVEQYYRAGTLAKPSVNAIVHAVGKHFKIDANDIHGISRKAPIVHVRHIAVYITRELTGDSWKHIGSQFGDRDHTSMMHGYQKIAEMMNQDKDLSATVKMLIRNLYPEA
jgi:chromosomal replication initiator protein